MRILELFSGSGVLSAVARERGHEAITVDAYQPADLRITIDALTPELLKAYAGWEPGSVDMIWASPPCTGFSVASIGKHWVTHNGTPYPKHPTSVEGIRLLKRTLELIALFRAETFFIENPRGMMRRMPELARFNRVTITYCQYGERFMKPTDVWTNARHWWPHPPCKNGDACHERAPRGSRKGLQAVKTTLERGTLPRALCEEVIAACETTVSHK